jgi:hypothetical protein
MAAFHIFASYTVIFLKQLEFDFSSFFFAQNIQLLLRQDQVDNLNSSFTFEPGSFDLVNSRLVASGLNRQRWPRYVRDIVR